MTHLAVQERAVDAALDHRADPDAEAARIVQAAWAVLERSRFRSLKVRQVLLASNTSASNFYRHFASKSHLLLALLADETVRTDRQLMAKVEAADSAEGRLWAYVAFHVHIVHHHHRAERARLFLDQGLLEELPEQVGVLNDVMGGRLAEIICQGVQTGAFCSSDPVSDAGMVMNLISGLITGGLMRSPTTPEAQTVATTYDFVLRALGAPSTGSRPQEAGPTPRISEPPTASVRPLHSVR
jgi:AcrR family transcriptional regulator